MPDQPETAMMFINLPLQTDLGGFFIVINVWKKSVKLKSEKWTFIAFRVCPWLACKRATKAEPRTKTNCLQLQRELGLKGIPTYNPAKEFYQVY